MNCGLSYKGEDTTIVKLLNKKKGTIIATILLSKKSIKLLMQTNDHQSEILFAPNSQIEIVAPQTKI